ncbi:MAG: NifU family protein [Alphaproteobacteria bacterium]|nr:NifU family protein [Alphaproteobacteria bacterium]MBQ8677936.1 NifU family protein [Alphaproteobacteria bacterium]
MIIETQPTPDVDVLNFFPPQKLLPDNHAEFVDSKSLRHSPLAENLFDIGGIKSIFFTPDMISVTKEPQAKWETLKPQILAEIMDFITSGQDIINKTAQENSDNIVPSIISLLNARIRPAVARDGGDIKFRAFEDGIVFVEMLGHCSGCPYAAQTLKEGVEKILQTYIPEVKEVKNISEKE